MVAEEVDWREEPDWKRKTPEKVVGIPLRRDRSLDKVKGQEPGQGEGTGDGGLGLQLLRAV